MTSAVLIFDLDGVLIDTSRSYDLAVAETVQYFLKREISQEEVQRSRQELVINNDWDLTEALIRRNGLKSVVKKDIVDHFQQVYIGTETCPGTRMSERWLLGQDVLQRLSRKYQLAICTGRERDEAQWALQRFDTKRFFNIVVAMEDVKREKPDPEGLRLVLSKLGTDKGIYVGDTLSDLKAVKPTGLAFIGVIPPWLKEPDKLRQAFMAEGITNIINDISQIEEVLP